MVELGAGCGLCGVLCGVLGADITIITDGNEDCVALIEENIALNDCNETNTNVAASSSTGSNSNANSKTNIFNNSSSTSSSISSIFSSTPKTTAKLMMWGKTEAVGLLSQIGKVDTGGGGGSGSGCGSSGGSGDGSGGDSSGGFQGFDFCMASDVIYDTTVLPPLMACAVALLKPGDSHSHSCGSHLVAVTLRCDERRCI